jgi:hypothetical protein
MSKVLGFPAATQHTKLSETNFKFIKEDHFALSYLGNILGLVSVTHS